MVSHLVRFLLGVAVIVAVPCGRAKAAEIPLEGAPEGRMPLAGWVFDPEGRPVEGVEIWVVPEYRGDITSATLDAGPAAVTGPDGRYESRDWTVGDAKRLRACRKGYVPEEFPPASKPPRTVLSPVVHLAGRVVDAEGEPIPDARIFAGLYSHATPSDLIPPDPPCPFDSSALAGARGAFTVGLEAPGLYEVTASREGYLSTTLKYFPVPPEGVAGVEIRLDSGTTVSGHVTDAEGRSIAAASITVTGSRGHGHATADDDGEFLVKGIEPGEPRLEVSYTGYETKELLLQVPPEGTQVDVVLDPVREIRGRVIGPDGSPIGGALIHITSLQQTTTLDDGSFVAEVSKDVYKLITPPVGLMEVTHDLQFPPLFKVQGRVTGPEGKPIEGARLWFTGNAYTDFQTQTLKDGSFVAGVTNGTYTLAVAAEGYSGREAARPVVVAGAPVKGIEIQLGKASSSPAGFWDWVRTGPSTPLS